MRTNSPRRCLINRTRRGWRICRGLGTFYSFFHFSPLLPSAGGDSGILVYTAALFLPFTMLPRVFYRKKRLRRSNLVLSVTGPTGCNKVCFLSFSFSFPSSTFFRFVFVPGSSRFARSFPRRPRDRPRSELCSVHRFALAVLVFSSASSCASRFLVC